MAGSPVPEALTDEGRDLAFYGAIDGSELLVDAVDLVEKSEKEKKERDEMRKARAALEQHQLADRDTVASIIRDDDYY